MSHIFTALEPDAYDRRYLDRQILGRLLERIRPQRGRVAVVVACLVLGAAAGAGVPYFLAQIVGTIESDTSVWPPVLWLAAAGLASWLVFVVGQVFSGAVVQDLLAELRDDTFEAVTRKNLAFFDSTASGSLVSRILTDTQSFANALQIGIDVVGQFLLVIVMAAVLLFVNPLLAGITVVLAVVIVLVTIGFRRISRTASQREARAVAQVNSFVQEAIAGIAVARNFRQESATAAGLAQVNDTWYLAALRLNRLFSGIIPFLMTLTGLATVAVVWFGGQAVAAGSIPVSELFLFLETLALFWFPLTGVASFWNQFQQGLAAGERIMALQDAEPSVVQRSAEPVASVAGNFRFEGVMLEYRPGVPVLRGLDLHVPAGSTVALVGETGAGKSSVLRVLARSYEFGDGRVTVDGRDIRSLDLEQYRARLGVLTQQPFLLTGTVRENIALGRLGAADAEIRAAAERIADGEWLGDLEAGFDTEVQEGGKNLSVGQRQLVSLARVMLQDPDVLLMDEATSSIDPVTDAQVQKGLRDATDSRTTVIIAHRLPTVLHADALAVIGDGRILEFGSHPQLIAQGGAYTALYGKYFGHQSVGATS